MKKYISTVTALFIILALAGCSGSETSSTSESVKESIQEYLINNVGYEITNIHVVEDDDGTYLVNGALPADYDISDFPAFAVKFVETAEAAAEKNGVTLTHINPVIYTGENEWVGWSTDGKSVYNQDKFLQEDVELEDLPNVIAALFLAKEEPEPEPEEPAEPDFGDRLDIYQGEWKQDDSRYITLVINGETLNTVHTSNIGKKTYRSVRTTYFSLDEDDRLIDVNKNGKLLHYVVLGDGTEEEGADSEETGDEPAETEEVTEAETGTEAETEAENDTDTVDIETEEDNEGSVVTEDEEVEPLRLTLYYSNGTIDKTYTKISNNTEVPAEMDDPEIGMTENEVLSSAWGKPNKRNTTETAFGTHEQWVYDFGYVYFDNGIVTSIQETK